MSIISKKMNSEMYCLKYITLGVTSDTLATIHNAPVFVAVLCMGVFAEVGIFQGILGGA